MRWSGRRSAAALAMLVGLVVVLPPVLDAQEYDLVIANGRVIDPESGLDAVRHVAVRDGSIVAVSETPLQGRSVVDATDLVVAPGFIDLHSHAQTDDTYRYRAQDGVTTALELEVGTADVAGWYREREPGRLINYGVSIGHVPVRMAVLGDSGVFLPSGPATADSASPAQVDEIRRRIREGLREGAVGVGMGVAYTPAARSWEILEVFRVAARQGAPVYVHTRQGMGGLVEAIAAAAITGASLHVVHLNSSAKQETPHWLQIVEEARARGVDVTTEAYPYTAGMTRIETALFDDWREWPDERFAQIEWVATGERLTRESFGDYREIGGTIVLHQNTDSMVAKAIASPLTLVASDAYMENDKGHPRTIGTYSRVLGRYVREQGALSLGEAIRKMTLMPARRLEGRVPGMKRKGRIQPGADADITVFDPARVIDRATYRQPTIPPIGIVHVLVGGVRVVRDGAVVDGVAPGNAVRARSGAAAASAGP